RATRSSRRARRCSTWPVARSRARWWWYRAEARGAAARGDGTTLAPHGASRRAAAPTLLEGRARTGPQPSSGYDRWTIANRRAREQDEASITPSPTELQMHKIHAARGQGMTEYVVIVALIAVAAI